MVDYVEDVIIDILHIKILRVHKRLKKNSQLFNIFLVFLHIPAEFYLW